MIRRVSPGHGGAGHLRVVGGCEGAGGLPMPCAGCEARGLAPCGALDATGLGRFADILEQAAWQPGEPLAQEGESARHVYSITSGVVRLYKLLADGRRQIIGFLGAGDLIGLSAAERYGATAEAIGPVTACRFRRSEYQRALGQTAGLQRALLRRAADDLAAAQEHVLLLGRKTAAERVASFLTDRAAASRQAGGDGVTLELPMTRGEIADYLGLTIETVSRVISRFRDQGLVRIVGLHGVVLQDARAVADMAG